MENFHNISKPLISVKEEFIMRSPLKTIREKRGWTRGNLAKLLKTSSYVIGRIEDGTMRIPAEFYDHLRAIGVDPFELAVAQEAFLEWRKEFHFCLRWGIVPPVTG